MARNGNDPGRGHRSPHRRRPYTRASCGRAHRTRLLAHIPGRATAASHAHSASPRSTPDNPSGTAHAHTLAGLAGLASGKIGSALCRTDMPAPSAQTPEPKKRLHGHAAHTWSGHETGPMCHFITPGVNSRTGYPRARAPALVLCRMATRAKHGKMNFIHLALSSFLHPSALSSFLHPSALSSFLHLLALFSFLHLLQADALWSCSQKAAGLQIMQ
eukprot:1951113-Rhodomonas_salina.1